MPASVALVVRKFVDGNENYKRSLRLLIEGHPERDTIVRTIEAEHVDYKTGNKTS